MAGRQQVAARETILRSLGEAGDVFVGALLLLRGGGDVTLRGVERRGRHAVVARRGEHGLHAGLVALRGGIARGGEQPLVQIVVEARDELRPKRPLRAGP